MLLLQPLGVNFLMIWLSSKQECSKLSQVLLLQIRAKKGVIKCRQVKNYYIAWRGVRQISDKLKFSKTLIHQAVARLTMFDSFQDLSSTGRPKVTSQRDDHIAMKMIVRLSSTFNKKI